MFGSATIAHILALQHRGEMPPVRVEDGSDCGHRLGLAVLVVPARCATHGSGNPNALGPKLLQKALKRVRAHYALSVHSVPRIR